MFNSTVLDVALGLVFVYLLLSLICTALGEVIESFLKRRAKTLERGIREMLTDKDANGKPTSSLIDGLYNHPLIASLFEGKYDPTQAARTDGHYAGKIPAYIPSRSFALALMDLLLPANGLGADDPTAPDGKALPAAPPAADPNAVSGAAGATTPAAAGNPPAANPLKPLRDAAAACQVVAVRDAILPLIDAAGTDVNKARQNIEDWYDGTMDRVSGWYKRYAQNVAIALALTVTLVMNADTIQIVRTLSRDPEVRKTLAIAAQQRVDSMALYAPDTDASTLNPNDPIPACRDASRQDECRLQRSIATVDSLGLPIGWDANDPRLVPHGGGWFLKVLGLLLTVAAVSLGAPFWFDMLNKIMVVRATVKPKEKSLDDHAKG